MMPPTRSPWRFVTPASHALAALWGGRERNVLCWAFHAGRVSVRPTVIAGVRGRVIRAEAGALVVAVGPVDVRVGVPSSTAMALTAGQEVRLHTHLHVREDQLALFGFESEAGLEIFERLLGVSGVGPKGALALLSTLSPAEVQRAIAEGDTRALARAPGIGQRAASRIITDLQDKLGVIEVESMEIGRGPLSAAVEALMNMGYSQPEARRALEGATGATAEELLRAALVALGGR